MNVGNAPSVRLSLLCGFELSVDKEPVTIIASAQRLVAFLALKDKPLGRAYVAGVLWPETTTSQASANLRSSLWRTQRACRQLITASVKQLALNPRVAVDARGAMALAHRLLDRTTPVNLDDNLRSDLLADLLPDWYDDWVLIERERYHQLRLHALEAMCERLTKGGRHGEAVDAGLAAVRAEPLRESAHQSLIKAYLAEGNRWEAMRQYHYCRRLLLNELGLEPSPTLRALLPDRDPEVPGSLRFDKDDAASSGDGGGWERVHVMSSDQHRR
jgi:DNA-binding SARP family transcriptional activator